VNREFFTLARIREAVKCDLELLVNNNCLSACAFSPAHMNALAHAGQEWHGNRGFFIDWCFLRCTEMKLRDPVNYIRSEWIRPEDLRLYEEMGYDLFKVTERDLPTPLMVDRVRAYAARRYDGNLLDLGAAVPLSARAGQPGPDAPSEATGGPAVHDPSGDRGTSGGCRQPGARRLHGTVPGKGVPRRGVRDVPLVPRFRGEGGRVNQEESRRALAAYDALFRSLDGGAMWRYLPGGVGRGTP
jgi:hypothetical protein